MAKRSSPREFAPMNDDARERINEGPYGDGWPSFVADPQDSFLGYTDSGA
jgi:hypothetical protein